MSDVFAQARAVADAVLYEGYLLYPYRASSDKNKMRWQFGVLVPPGATEATGEESTTRTECLCEPADGATVRLLLRFLHIRSRAIEIRDAAGFQAVDRVRIGDDVFTTWDEAVEREIPAELAVTDLLGAEIVVPFEVPASREEEPLPNGSGRIVRTCAALAGEIRVSATELVGPFGGVRLRVDVANAGTRVDSAPSAGCAISDAGVDVLAVPAEKNARDLALPRAFVGAHTLLGLSGGCFLSLTEPPEWATPATAELVNTRTWPVLVGDEGRADTMLSAPIILYDYPSIAPESPGALFDGTEIDEILTLRTMTLTDDEKREARATDDRAREILDRVDNMPPELLDRLHGTVRYLRQVTGYQAEPAADPMVPEAPWWDPAADASVDPDVDCVVIDGISVAKGSRVRLAPRLSGTDAQDMFLVGMFATVQAVVSDVDGSTHVAVTIDDDPAAELQHLQGRFRYFATTELEPVLT